MLSRNLFPQSAKFQIAVLSPSVLIKAMSMGLLCGSWIKGRVIQWKHISAENHQNGILRGERSELIILQSQIKENIRGDDVIQNNGFCVTDLP